MRRFVKELNTLFQGDRLFRAVTLEIQLTVCQDSVYWGLLDWILMSLKTSNFAGATRKIPEITDLWGWGLILTSLNPTAQMKWGWEEGERDKPMWAWSPHFPQSWAWLSRRIKGHLKRRRLYSGFRPSPKENSSQVSGFHFSTRQFPQITYP